jgi:hypothetical protein
VGKTDFSVVESIYGATVRTVGQADPESRRARLLSSASNTVVLAGFGSAGTVVG